MRHPIIIGALALACMLSAAQAQAPAAGDAGNSTPGAEARAAAQDDAAQALRDELFGAAFDIRATGPRDAQALQSARQTLAAHDRRTNAALNAFYGSRPRNGRIIHVNGAVAFSVDGRTMPLTPEQQHLLDAFRSARTARNNALLAIGMSAITAEDLRALAAAEAALAQGPPNSPQGSADAAAPRQAYEELHKRFRDKVRIRAMAERGPHRVVQDRALIGAELVVQAPYKPNIWSAPGSRILFSQPVAFNRVVRLTEEMSVEVTQWFRSKRHHTFARGTMMFAVVTRAGVDAYCPIIEDEGLAATFYYGDYKYFPCYFDADSDGRLESQRNGGERVDGLYTFGSFDSWGAVLTPARFEEAPTSDGHEQRAGIEVLQNNLSPGVQEIILGRWLASSANAPRLPLPLWGQRRVRIREGASATVELSGARIEFRYTGDGTIAFKVLECLPEEPLLVQGEYW